MNQVSQLPKKKTAEFPYRVTLNLRAEIGTVIDGLRDQDVDVPELLREAVDVHFKTKGLTPDGHGHASVKRENNGQEEICQK